MALRSRVGRELLPSGLRRGFRVAYGILPKRQCTIHWVAGRPFSNGGLRLSALRSTGTVVGRNNDSYTDRKEQNDISDHLGTTIGPHYEPHQLNNNPPRPRDVTLELLLASQAHLGHATSLWHPANQRYIFGVRQGIHIISLDVIAAHLRRAAKVVRGVSQSGGLILFVGTREGQERAVVEAAQRTAGFHIFERWVPGTMTNKQQILSERKLLYVDMLDRPDPTKNTDVAVRPDLVVCLNPMENQTLLKECGQCNIPTIGIIDTDCNPACVTYPIPANDDSLRAVQLIAGILGRAGAEGKQHRHDFARQKSRQ